MRMPVVRWVTCALYTCASSCSREESRPAGSRDSSCATHAPAPAAHRAAGRHTGPRPVHRQEQRGAHSVQTGSDDAPRP